MRFRKIALALFACMALGAFAANAAQAAGWTTGTTENRTTAGTLVPSGTHLAVNCKKHTGSTLTLASTVLGTPITLTANGIDCVNGKIDNSTEAGHSEGSLTFTEVTVSPSSCKVPGNEITTNALTDKVIMDPSGGTVVFDKFFTHSGPFVEITLEGAECPFNEAKVAVNGTACGESVNNNLGGTNVTGTLTKVQTLSFSAAAQTTGGCELKLGKAAATLTGVVDNELASGAVFGSD